MKENQQSEETQYQQLGVDANKESVREAFGKIINNEYPGAFVNIVSDPFDESRVMTQHQDGDGSKFIQRILGYCETGDPTIFRGAVDDALAMNTGDIAASGFVFGPWLITDVLNLNLTKEAKLVVMEQIATRFLELKTLYEYYGFKIKFLGGETADLPDQVRSGVFDLAITAWADRRDVIAGNVQVNDVIHGLRSDGQAPWEEKPNSGLMSNGLTLARKYLMRKYYNKQYPYLSRGGDFYQGRFDFGTHNDDLGMTVGEALLSPTRQWAIIIRHILELFKKAGYLDLIHGITMNTGGGCTKIRHLGKGICYRKKMPEPPPIFKLIQQESQVEWKEMFEDFNCGIGLDFITPNHPVVINILQAACRDFRLPAPHWLGFCHESSDGENRVILETDYGTFEY